MPKQWAVLYLFAGRERHADIGFFLKEAAAKNGCNLVLDEFDILRGEDQDLTQDGTWELLKSKLVHGFYNVVIVAPPCNTFSRARHNTANPGPKPLRSLAYVKGFPWLREADRAKVEQANLLVLRSLEACGLVADAGGVFLLEHPEQLGLAGHLVPASIWDWEEFKILQDETGLQQAALFQCEFGAITSKPTRLASTVPGFDSSPLGKYLGKHILDEFGGYVGPLPNTCPHKQHSHKLIGKANDGTWKTGPAASYPPGLCKEMATLLVSWLLQPKGGRCIDNMVQKPMSGDLQSPKFVVENTVRMGPPSQLEKEEGSEDTPQLFHGRLEQAAIDNSGLPMTCRWQNRPKSFADGGGLNSPGRWHPRDRGTGLSTDRVAFVDQLALIIRTFVIRHIVDLKRSTFQLATGHMKEMPFTKEALDELREQWFQLLGGAGTLGVVTPHQPFFLFALEETLRRMGDEDADIISRNSGDNYVEGRLVGAGTPFDPAPLVFRGKEKGRVYDDSEFVPLAQNYPSAEEATQIIQQQFEEEEKLGWMYPLSEAEARKRFGARLRVASLAAIPKDEATVRVLFDGTHSVQVNNEIQIKDRLEFPSPAELAHVMEHMQESQAGVVLAIAADIQKAHRRFLHREEDHGLLGCRASSSSSTIWINRVGTFGVACAALHFGRLAGAIFRVVIRILKRQPGFQLLFADDLKLIVSGSSKYLDLWMMIVAWLLVGTPFSWRKFRGGVALDYVGFWTDYSRFELGLSEKRALWVVKVIEDLQESQFVMTGRSFSELLGRLGFASQAIPWLRPVLGPLYAWDGTLSPFMAARLPVLVVITLQLVRARFKLGEFTSPCWSPVPSDGDSFRTDAKCESGRIVCAGWEIVSGGTRTARWFSFEVLASDAPWLFYKGVEVQRMSTSAELLATYAALHAFDYVRKGHDARSARGRAMVAAGTDNFANEQLSRKRLSTKLPLGLMLLQHCIKCWDNGIWVDIRWRPREENQEADDLTNDKFSSFQSSNRVQICYQDLDTRILGSLQIALAELEESSEVKSGTLRVKGLSKRLKLETKTKW